MDSRTTTWMIALCLLGTLAMYASLSAQEPAPASPPTYTVFPLRTLGGPQSNVTPFARLISSSHVMVGSADTADINPNFPNGNGLLGSFPYVQHAATTAAGARNDLGALPGGPNSSTALWISATGTVTGISENGVTDPLVGGPEIRAVVWKNGQMTDLGTLGGDESIAWAVNSSDQVAGCAANTIPDDNSAFGWGTQTRAFLYQTTMQDLGTLGGTDACATMMNDAGQVAGFSYTASGDFDSFIWANQQMKDIGNLGGTFGYPNAINSSGQVTGASNLSGDSITHGYFWDGAAIHDLGSLSSGFQSNYSQGIWINDAGHVAGESRFSPVSVHAVLWKDGTMTDLGTLPGDLCSVAWGINSHDQVVGASGLCDSPQHAFLWQNGQMYDLTHVLPTQVVMTSAFYINDAGEIAVVGNVGRGGNGAQAYTTVQHAYLLVPTGGSGSDSSSSTQSSISVGGADGYRRGLPGARYRGQYRSIRPQE